MRRLIAAAAACALGAALLSGCLGSSASDSVSSQSARSPLARQQGITLHLGIGRRHASIPVVYAKSAPTFSITTTKPAAAKLTGYFDVEGLHLATIGCPSRPQATCRAGPFESVKLGTGPWVWRLRITKHSTPSATVRIVVQFR